MCMCVRVSRRDRKGDTRKEADIEKDIEKDEEEVYSLDN